MNEDLTRRQYLLSLLEVTGALVLFGVPAALWAQRQSTRHRAHGSQRSVGRSQHRYKSRKRAARPQKRSYR